MLASTLLIAGLVLLVISQKKKDRTLAIAALVCFVLSLGMNDLIRGFIAGYNGS